MATLSVTDNNTKQFSQTAESGDHISSESGRYNVVFLQYTQPYMYRQDDHSGYLRALCQFWA